MTSRLARRLLTTVERAYDLDVGPRAWLQGILDELDPAFGAGSSIAIEYDSTGKIESWFVEWAATNMSSSEQAWMSHALCKRPVRELMRAAMGRPERLPSALKLSELVGSIAASPLRLFTARFGVTEVLAFNANDGTERGVFLGLRGKPGQAPPIARANRVLPHVSAALRIRNGIALQHACPPLPGAPHGAEAMLDVDGIVRDGQVAPSHRELLRRIVLERDRLRLARSDPDEALAAWTALVEGRWSLVDVFERNGKRWVLAIPNLPDVRDPRALAPLERAVFGLVARGRSNKAIGFELGLSEGTVCGYLRDIRLKLGAETVRAAASATQARTSRLRLGSAEIIAMACDAIWPAAPRQALTGAEQCVVELLLSGASNRQIAEARRSSMRTVANQIASAYVKLGLGSRRELRAALASGHLPLK